MRVSAFVHYNGSSLFVNGECRSFKKGGIPKMRMSFLVLGLISLLLEGCGNTVLPLSKPHLHFVSLPSNPSMIVVTKYMASRGSASLPEYTSTLTGTKMENIYKVLQQDSKHLPSSISTRCPSPPARSIAWNYHLVIHYPNHKSLSFTQITVACTYVQDDQTGYSVLGALPGLTPFSIQVS